MKRVFSDPSGVRLDYLAALLRDHGIACLLRNQLLGGGAGELPPTEIWPELWVLEDGDAPRAGALIEQALTVTGPGPWTCPACGERVDEGFGQCWSCGKERPE
ncbi:MAG: DUF2007 domain-containing protein [Gammaproteobacteria bacterium]|nr:MAG: DUF2007 domain-containing protein [Gammaproteobacteria bacterium]